MDGRDDGARHDSFNPFRIPPFGAELVPTRPPLRTGFLESDLGSAPPRVPETADLVPTIYQQHRRLRERDDAGE